MTRKPGNAEVPGQLGAQVDQILDMAGTENPQDLLSSTLTTLRTRGDWQHVLDGLPVPIYTTDADGMLTYCNPACEEFAGRKPQVGTDRWCVTWQLYTTGGENVPHDQCPMATAIKSRRTTATDITIARRPDGSRRAFRPYPALLIDDDGRLEGAVNILIDVTAEQAGALAEQASRCRRLARSTNDAQAADILGSMAREYDSTAAALRVEA